MPSKTKRIAERFFLRWLPLGILLAFVMIPLLWTLSLSFKYSSDVVSETFTILPNPFTFSNYTNAWSSGRISQYFFNSLVISLCAVAVVSVLVLFNGYALSRFKFRGKQAFMVIMLMTQMLPRIIIISPLYLLMRDLGLVDRFLSVILVEIASAIPFQTLLMKGFIGGVPKEIDEAAMIDGCNPLQIFFQVVCPILKPTMISTAILETMWVWNDYLLPTLVLDIKTFSTIPMAIQYFRGSYGKVEMAPMMACIMITVLPVIVLYLACQKYIIDGVVAGAVKG